MMRLLLGYAFAKAAALVLVKRRPVYVGTRLAALTWGDGRHDDTRSLQLAMDTAVGDGGLVKLDAGRFILRGDGLVIRNLHITGSGLHPGEARLRVEGAGRTVRIGCR